MGEGRRSSLPARGTRAKRGKPAKGATHIAPLYKRLPHGPHRLGRDEVVLHQRARIHGAMVEAVGEGGYEGTSVRQVIALAGVSRRSFYEQFANKEACFLATFDLIVRRDVHAIAQAYSSSRGPLQTRAEPAFGHVERALRDERSATRLVVVEAQRVGPAGVARLRDATGACEQLLARAFTEARDCSPLPAAVTRCVAGGLHGAASACLRAGAMGHARPAGELMDWVLLFRTLRGTEVAERLSEAVARRSRELAPAYGRGLPSVQEPTRDVRARLMHAALRLATQEDFHELTGPQVADAANLPIDAFCEVFDSRDECYLAALDVIADEMLAIAADAELVSDQWPHAVRRVTADLTRYLADRPLYGRTLAQEACFAGGEAFERVVELWRAIATLLTEGAPRRPAGELTVDAVAGALWHTVRSHALGGRPQVLAALADPLAYAVLTPFIGSREALEAATGPR
jgi:AcrR family transcriptional regulator